MIRRDAFGWRSRDRRTVGRLEYVFDIKAKLIPGGGYYDQNEKVVKVEDVEAPWVYTSGVRGLARCELPLLGDGDEAAKYTIKLCFAELESCDIGQRSFDIKLQGDLVAENVDVIKEVGSSGVALLRNSTVSTSARTCSSKWYHGPPNPTKRHCPA